MLNVELIERVEQTFRKLGLSDRTSDNVVARIGLISPIKAQCINNWYQKISDKIEYLRNYIPRFAELCKPASEADDPLLIETCNDREIHTVWYRVITHVAGRDPMSRSMVWDSNIKTDRDWMGKYIRDFFSKISLDTEQEIHYATNLYAKKSVSFGDELSYPVVEVEDYWVEYRKSVGGGDDKEEEKEEKEEEECTNAVHAVRTESEDSLFSVSDDDNALSLLQEVDWEISEEEEVESANVSTESEDSVFSASDIAKDDNTLLLLQEVDWEISGDTTDF